MLLQDVRCQLCSKDDDVALFKWIEGQLKDAEERLAKGQAALFTLQTLLMNVACDDPGAAIGMQLALPILQVGCACLDELCRRVPDAVLPLRDLNGLVRCPICPGMSALQSFCIAGPNRLQALGCAALRCLRAP